MGNNVNAQESTQEKVEFWFDAVCPWTWITSRWMADINDRLGLNVAWQPFSLKLLNAGRPDDSHREGYEFGHRLGRLFCAVGEAHGNEKLGELYREIGERIHPGERGYADEIISESLDAVGIPAEILAVSEEARFDEALEQSTRRGLDLVGPNVGVPIIAIDEQAFFGPVVSPAPKGDDALNLWTSVSLAIKTPGFSELKRGRSGGLDFGGDK